MGVGPVGWTVTFRSCEDAQDDCDAARFDVVPPQDAACCKSAACYRGRPALTRLGIGAGD